MFPTLSLTCSPSLFSSRVARGVRRAAMLAGASYAGATLGYALLRPLLGKRDGWLELVDDLEPWAYVPTPAIWLLGAALGSGPLGAAGAAMAAAFGLRWGHRYLRRAPVSGA